MNATPRPSQVSPLSYSAELRWPAMLGGETEIVGPFKHSYELRRRVAGIRGGYPGSMQPSVTFLHEERVS